MWLLPDDLGDARTRLPPGRHLLPWYLSPTDVTRLTSLVGRLLPDITSRVEVPFEALPLPHELRRPEQTMVVVRVPEGVAAEEADARLHALGGRLQLVQLAEPEPEGYGWEARYVKPVVLTLLRRHLADPDHSLAHLGVASLPMRAAAALTSEALELLDLLSEAIEHRVTFAREGIDGAEFAHSIRVVAGRRLARRLMRLPADALVAAVDVVLAGPKRLDRVEDALSGARALETVGLARVSGTDVVLLEMVRGAARHRELRGAFLQALPAQLAEPARRWLPEVDSGFGSDKAVQPHGATRRSGDSMWHELYAALEDALEELGSTGLVLEPALRQLGQVMDLPGYVDALPRALADEVVTMLRNGERLQGDGSPLGRLAGLVFLLLRAMATRGADRVRLRDNARNVLSHQATPEGAPEVYALAYGAVTAELAWDLIATAGDRATLEQAEGWCVAALEVVDPDTATAAALLGVLAHLHNNRGEPEHALTIHQQRLAIYQSLGAQREAAVTQARIARIRASWGELDEALALHQAALDVFIDLDARHDHAITLGDIARIVSARGDTDEALRLHRSRLEMLEAMGARHSCAIALGDVARLLAAEGQLDEALALHRRRLGAFEALGEHQARAIALGDVARIHAARGEYDEALRLHRERLDTFESLDDLDGVAVTRLRIGRIEHQRGHLGAAHLELQTALALNRRLRHAEGIATACEALGRLLVDLDSAAGPTLLSEAADRFEQLGQAKRAKKLRKAADKAEKKRAARRE